MAIKNYVTPAGKSLFAIVHTPDTHFDADGIYQVSLLLNREEASGLIDTLDKLLDEYVATDTKIQDLVFKKKVRLSKQPFFTVDEETGDLKFKFKQRAKIPTKSGKILEKKIAVYDSALNPTKVLIGNGSIIKVSFTVSPYYLATTKSVGLSLRLSAVQILKLIEYTGEVDYGFTNEANQDAFVAEEGTQHEGFKPEVVEEAPKQSRAPKMSPKDYYEDSTEEIPF